MTSRVLALLKRIEVGGGNAPAGKCPLSAKGLVESSCRSSMAMSLYHIKNYQTGKNVHRPM